MPYPFPPSAWLAAIKVNQNANLDVTKFIDAVEINFISSSISATALFVNALSSSFDIVSGNLNLSATIWNNNLTATLSSSVAALSNSYAEVTNSYAALSNSYAILSNTLAVSEPGEAYLTSSIFTPDGGIFTVTGTDFAVKATTTDANFIAGVEISASSPNVSTGFDIRTHRDFASAYLKVVDDGTDAYTRFQQIGYYNATSGAPQLDVFAGMDVIQNPADQVSVVCNTRLEIEAQHIALNALTIQLTGSTFSPAAKVYATNGLEVYSDAGISISGSYVGLQGWVTMDKPLGIDFGNHNVGVGWYALEQHRLDPGTFGGMNVAVGFQTQQFNSGGWDNISLGFQSLMYNATGGSNIAIGSSAATNTSASDNIALGTYALNENNTGSSNVVIGSYAMRATTGSNNIAIGSDAGRYIVGATNNINTNKSIFIGSGTIAAAAGGINEIVIGVGATGHGSNTVTIGAPATTLTLVTGALEITGTAATTLYMHSPNGNRWALTIDNAGVISTVLAP